MRIVFLNLASEWGGGEGWTLRTAVGLRDRKHDVFLIGREDSPLVARGEQAGLPTLGIAPGSDYSPVLILRLYRILRRLRAQVLVVHQNKDVRTGGVAARLAGVAVVHRNGFPIVHDKRRHRFGMRFVDRILTNSQRIRDRYLSYGWMKKIPIDVVPNGILVSSDPVPGHDVWAPWKFPGDALIALYAGRLTTVKRVSDLLKAVASLPDDSRWRLAIAGAGDREAALHLAADEMKIGSRVAFLGFREDTASLVGAADLAVLPSEDEGMPNALMEAMARGVPVAATPVGDVRMLLEDGRDGWLVPVGDVPAWTALFKRLEDSTGELAEMGVRGRKRVLESFTFSAMLDGVEACLKRALGGDVPSGSQ